MLYLVFFILGIIGLIISVIFIANSEFWPAYSIVIMPFIFLIIISLRYGEQCINCGEVYAKYKVCCPRCGSHESTEIKDKEEVNINSVDVNCNEFSIHKIEKKHAYDEVNEGKYCSSCGGDRFTYLCVLTLGLICFILLVMMLFF